VHADDWEIAGCPVNGPAVAAEDRRVAVAWYTYAASTHRVRLAFSEDAGASFAAPIAVDAPRGTRAPMGRVSVVLDGDSAIVGWLASDREDASILLRRVGVDGTVGGELRIGGSTAGRDAGFPRVARLGDELVAIWTEPGETSRLRAVRLPLAAIPRAPADAATAEPAPAIAAGAPAPAIELPDLSGATRSLASLRGKVVLVNLWATWCEPCRHELPVLTTLHQRDAARGLAIVAINIDRKKTRDEIAAFAARQQLPFAVWLDPDDRASAALGATSYPVNILVDRDGTIVWRRDGAIRPDDGELRAALEAALTPR
jgi:thiol-disulfide isomerase/thioredoxin